MFGDYLDHVVPSDKRGPTISIEILRIAEKYGFLETLLMLFTDGEPANT